MNDIISSIVPSTPSPSDVKAQAVPSLAVQKAELIRSVTANKQAYAYPKSVLIDKLNAELARVSDPNYGTEQKIKINLPPENIWQGVERGGAEAVKGFRNTGVGLLAGGAAVAETLFGEGGAATDIKKYAVEKYNKYEEETSRYIRPEDSFNYSYEKAKEGDLGALISWAAHGGGYVAAQLGSLLVGGGIISKGVQLTSKKAVAEVFSTMVENQAKRMAKEQLLSLGAKTSINAVSQLAKTDLIRSAATSLVTKKVGQQIGMGTSAFSLEAGEIMGRLSADSVKEDRALTGHELSKGITASILAGGVEYLELALGLKALKGQLGGGFKAESISGIKGKVARTGISATKVAPLEYAQEYTQTGLEQWGEGKPVLTHEAELERRDAGALGALGAGASIGSMFSKSTSEQEAADLKRQNKQATGVRAQHGYKKKLDKAVETKDITNISDINHKDYNPILAVDALFIQNTEKEIDPVETIKNHDRIIEINDRLDAKIDSILDEYATLDPKKDKQRRTELTQEAIKYDAFRTEIASKMKEINNIAPIDSVLQTNLNKAIESGTDEEVKKATDDILGSRGRIKIDIEKLAANANISPRERNKLEAANALTEYQNRITAQREAQEKEVKGISQVHKEIVDGISPREKGIPDFLKAITIAMNANKTDLAIEQLDKLRTFADRQQTRATTFRNYRKTYDKPAEGQKRHTLTPDDISNMEMYNTILKRNTGGQKTKYDVTGSFETTIENMEDEAVKLQLAVKLGEALIGVESKPTKSKETITPQVTPPVVDKLVKSLAQLITEEKQISKEWYNTPKDNKDKRNELALKGKILQKQIITAEIDELLDNSNKKSVPERLGLLEDFSTDDFTVEQDKQMKVLYEKLTDKEYEDFYGKKRPIEIKSESKPKTETKPKKAEAKPEVKPKVKEPEVSTEKIKLKLVTHKDGKTIITNQNGNTEVTVNSLDELIDLSNQFDKLMRSAGKVTRTDKHVAWFRELFQELAKLNVEFKPIKIKFKKEITQDSKKLLGRFYSRSNLILLSTANEYNINPIKVVLHEYAHALTSANLDKYPELRKRIRAIMDHALTQNPVIEKLYGFKTEEEFLAETISSPFFQLELDKLKPLNKLSLVEEIKRIFTALLKRLDSKEISLLTEALSVTLETIRMTDDTQQTEKEQEVETTKKTEVKPKSKEEKPEVETEVIEEEKEEILDTTERLSEEEINTVNHVTAYFGAINTKLQSLVSKSTDFLADIVARILDDTLDIGEDGKTLAQSFIEFTDEVAKVLPDQAFQYKKRLDYHYENPINYFANENGELPDKVVNAISTVIFEWLGTQGPGTLYNNDESINSLLGLNREDPVIREARRLLSHVGDNSEYLNITLGRKILKHIGIKVVSKMAPTTSQERLERSLGTAALATMEAMGHITRTTVHTPALLELTNASRNKEWNYKVERAETKFYSPTHAGLHEAKTIFFVITSKSELNENDQREITDENKKISDEFGAAKGVWEQLLGLSENEEEYSFKQPKYKPGKKWQLTKTDEVVVDEQGKNLELDLQQPYALGHSIANVFAFLTGQYQLDAMGFKKGYHQDHESNVESTNNQILRSRIHFMDWIHNASKQPDSYSSKFWINARFQGNARMLQISNINLQNNKPHRYLFGKDDWKVTFNPNEKSITNASFLEAVAQSFGIESSKEKTISIVHKKLQAKLKEADIKTALEALDTLFDQIGDNTAFNPETIATFQQGNEHLMKAIVTGIKAGGEDLHSLKGLVEYQRYVRAKKAKTDFTTDISIEIDGKANGSTIGSIQLANDVTLEKLAILVSEGLVFVNKPKAADHRSSNDPYESIGSIWGRNLSQMKQDLATAIRETTNKVLRNKKLQTLHRINAAEAILGNLYLDTGYLAKITRKMAKNRSVGATYGSGADSIKLGLVVTIIEDKIKDRLAEIAANINKTQAEADLKSLIKNVGILSGVTDEYAFGYDKKEKLLKMTISRQVIQGIAQHINDYHGAALVNAINIVYGDLQENRKPLNQGINIITAQYNTAQQALINQHYLTHDVLTIGDLEAIRETLKGMLPRVKTPMGGYISLHEFVADVDYTDKPGSVIKPEFPKSKRKENAVKLVTFRSRPRVTSVLKSPGVTPLIFITHMLESMTMNRTIGNKENIAILGVHDAAIVRIDQAARASEILNEHFYNDMSNYSMAQAVQDAINEANNAYEELDATGIFNKTLFKEAETDVFAKMKITEFEYKGKTIKTLLSKVKTDNAENIEEVVTRTVLAKDIIMNATVYMNQYHHHNGGFKTGNTAQKIINGIPTNTIISTAKERVDRVAEENVAAEADVKIVLQEAIDEIIGSHNSSTDMSLDPNDYAIQEEINQRNALDLYNLHKNQGNKIDSPQHDNHLQRILSVLVENVLNPIDLFLKTNPDDETHGVYQPESATQDKRIFISNQNGVPTIPVSRALMHGLRMSTGEVYAHEYVHAATHYGLQMSKQLLGQVKILFRLAEQNLTYKAFLNDPTIDVTDPANKYEVTEAILRYDRIFGKADISREEGIDSATGIDYTRDKSTAYDEFVALGITNENFNKALTGISIDKHAIFKRSTWANIKKGNLQEVLVSVFQKIMELLYERLVNSANSPDVATELERLAVLMSKIDSNNKGVMHTATKVIDNVHTQVTSKGNQYIKQAFNTWPVLRVVNGLIIANQHVIGSDTVTGQIIRNGVKAYHDMDYGIVKSIMTEIASNTDRMQFLHDLLRRRKIWLDNTKEAIVKQFKQYSNALFTLDQNGNVIERELTKDEKVVLTKVGIRADLSAILDPIGLDELAKMLADPNILQDNIDIINNKILADSALAPYAGYYKEASLALGYFMITGKGIPGKVTFRSTRVIASLMNTDNTGALNETEVQRAEDLIEQLTSLYALQNTSLQQRNDFGALLAENPNAIKGIFRLHQQLKEQALDKAFNGNKYQFIKGYTKQLLNPLTEYEIGTIDDEAEFNKKGFTRIATELERDESDPTKHMPLYAYVARSGRVNDFLSMTASYTSNRARGGNSMRVAMQLGFLTTVGRANNAQIIINKEADIRNMGSANPSVPNPRNKSNPMIPVVNDVGQIVSYNYLMNEITKDTYLEQDNDVDTIIGQMAGQIVDKQRSPVLNEELVDALKWLYEQEYSNNAENYVEISAFSEDAKLREIWFMLPDTMRAYIEDQWGEPKMYVAKDVLAIAFGYRKYSIVDVFGRVNGVDYTLIKNRSVLEKEQVKFQEKIEEMIVLMFNKFFPETGIKKADSLNYAATKVTKIAKNNIIIKALDITLDNLFSNLFYTKSRGVSFLNIIKYGSEAIIEGLKYQASKETLAGLELDLLVAQKNKQSVRVQNIEIKIQRVLDEIARNPTTKTIEAGLMPGVVEDIESTAVGTEWLTPNEQRVKDAIETYVPVPVQNVGKVVLLTQGTKAYKALNNMVKMTDFIGRHIMYNYYTSTERGDAQLSHKQAVIKAEAEFVNFSTPTHKMIEYFNETGFIWFSKFAFRILKPIVGSIQDKPFNVLLAFLMSSHVGADNILNSTLGVTKNPLENLSTPLHAISQNLTNTVTFNLIKKLFGL